MAKKYIEAEDLMRRMYERAFETDGDTMWQSGCWVRYRAIEAVVKETPAADVVELVRCCKCIYWDRDTIRHQGNDFRDWNEAECKILAERGGYNEIDRYTEADDYCSHGEEKDG